MVHNIKSMTKTTQRGAVRSNRNIPQALQNLKLNAKVVLLLAF